MDTTRTTEEILTVGTWRPQHVVAAEVDQEAPFTVTLTFADGYQTRLNLYDENAKNLGVVLRDPAAFQSLHVDPELGTIVWSNGFDYDPDSLRLLAIAQNPDDPSAIPAPLR